MVLYDNLFNSKADVVGKLEKITKKSQNFVIGDVRDLARLDETFKKYKIDAVIHFAGLKALGESVDDPLEYYSANVEGTINLFKKINKHGVKKVVFSSSATVHGNPQYLPIDVDHPTSASNP